MFLSRVAGMFALTIGSLAIAISASAQPGDKAAVPGPFRSFFISDERFEKGSTKNRSHKMHDMITDAGLNPFLVVFSRTVPNAADAPISKLAGRLDKMVIDNRGERFNAFIIFLALTKEYPEDDQRDAKAKEVTDLVTQLKTPNVPFALSASKSEATDAWHLGDTVETTVIFARQMKILKKWEFTADKPLDDVALQQITNTVQLELKPKR